MLGLGDGDGGEPLDLVRGDCVLTSEGERRRRLVVAATHLEERERFEREHPGCEPPAGERLTQSRLRRVPASAQHVDAPDHRPQVLGERVDLVLVGVREGTVGHLGGGIEPLQLHELEGEVQECPGRLVALADRIRRRERLEQRPGVEGPEPHLDRPDVHQCVGSHDVVAELVGERDRPRPPGTGLVVPGGEHRQLREVAVRPGQLRRPFERLEDLDGAPPGGVGLGSPPPVPVEA